MFKRRSLPGPRLFAAHCSRRQREATGLPPRRLRVPAGAPAARARQYALAVQPIRQSAHRALSAAIHAAGLARGGRRVPANRAPRSIRYQQATAARSRSQATCDCDRCRPSGFARHSPQPGPEAPPITTLRELHALWIDCGEAAYAAAAHREEFAAGAGGTPRCARGTARGSSQRAMTRLAIDPAPRGRRDGRVQPAHGDSRRSSSRRIECLGGGLLAARPRSRGATRRCSGVTSVRRPTRGLAPLVICYALVNRPYMLDLQPDRSLIRGLLARGLDVYLVDWGYPGPEDPRHSLDDYVNRASRRLHRSRAPGARHRSSQPPRRLPGRHDVAVPRGAAPGARAQPRHDGDAGRFPHAGQPAVEMGAKRRRRSPRRRARQRAGRIPERGLHRADAAQAHRRASTRDSPTSRTIAPALENFLRMERWIHDSPDQAGTAFRRFIRASSRRTGWCGAGSRSAAAPVDLRRDRPARSSISMRRRTTWCRPRPRGRSRA